MFGTGHPAPCTAGKWRRTTGPLLGGWIALIGTPIFLLKTRRMPRCTFRIAAQGIERQSCGAIGAVMS